MDRSRHITLFAQRLRDAAERGDWDRLERAVRELAPAMRILASHGPWTAAERAALRQLRAIHDGAFDASTRAAASLQARLDAIRGNKEGWLAYALADEAQAAEKQ